MSRPPPLPRFPRCVSWDGGRKETGHPLGGPFRMKCRRWPTLPRPLDRSTIGAVGLNDRVRDGNGCGPYALIASDFWDVAERQRNESSDRGDRFVIDRAVLCSDCVRSDVLDRNASSQAARAIRTAALGGCRQPSTGGLSTSSSPTALQGARSSGRVHLGGRFPLRCFQRLSPPAVATRRCPWQGNRDTSGPSDPVLSY